MASYDLTIWTSFLFNVIILTLSPQNAHWFFEHVMHYLDPKHKMLIDFLTTHAIPTCEHNTYIHNEKETKIEENHKKKKK
jgi:hypothetical protein